METAYELLEKGKELLRTGNPAQAALVLERAKKLYPKKASIREALGQAYYNYGQYSKAKKEFEKAVEIEPTNHYAHFGLGLSLNRSGQKQGALRHLKLALAMEPNSPDYARALDRVENKGPGGAKTKEAIKVQAYAGYKGGQTPRSFVFKGKHHQIVTIDKTWQEEQLEEVRKIFFRVLTKEGRLYDISYDPSLDEWRLEKEF